MSVQNKESMEVELQSQKTRVESETRMDSLLKEEIKAEI